MEHLVSIFHCCYCQFRTNLFSRYMKHLTLLHAHQQGFIVKCKEENCDYKSSSIDNFRHHFYRKHFTRLDNYETESYFCAYESVNTASLQHVQQSLDVSDVNDNQLHNH